MGFLVISWVCFMINIINCDKVYGDQQGLTLSRYDNTAFAGTPRSIQAISTLEGIEDCTEDNCGKPSSYRITGRIAPLTAGNYGFNVTFDPPLEYPSPRAYARLWVHDHLLYPRTRFVSGGSRSGGYAPLWIPLPPRALDLASKWVNHSGSAPLASYEVRFEYVCLKDGGCGDQKATIKWGTYDSTTPSTMPPFTTIPSSVMIPSQSAPEIRRRQLYSKLQSGWGTFYHNSILTWVLLPESFAVKVGLYRISTGSFLSPEGLTIDPMRLHQYAIRAGLHSYDSSYMEISVTWRDLGDNINVSIATTVDPAQSDHLTLSATVNNLDQVNASDFMITLEPNFTHGRAGTIHADNTSITGRSSGLRTSSLFVVQGVASIPTNVTSLPKTFLSVGLGTHPVIFSTEKAELAKDVLDKTKAYGMKEAATLQKYGSWAEVKDAMQSSLMWSFMYDPKEGLVAPVTRNWGFSTASIDGDQTDGLFCWDGSFASYMLSLDALDLSFSNLIQIIKMRTSAGFIPSYSSGTEKTRDRSNPPVTAKILHEITQRWGLNRTKWVVELCFDDLLNWNTWMYTRRREMPLGMLSWGSDPFPYAPDGWNGGSASTKGEGGGAAALESGLDNGPMFEGIPFNQTGLYVQDAYDVGYTGMYLMDCLAQIELAKIVGRHDAIATLQSRFDQVNKAMLTHLWNQTAGYFQSKLSADLTPIERMAPTNFYPLLVGPEKGPTETQASLTITRHLTNPSRFAVWPSATPPKDHPPPPQEARPLVQWEDKDCVRRQGMATTCTHTLCCPLACNDIERNQGVKKKVRYEGMGLGSMPSVQAMAALGNPELVALFQYNCNSSANVTDLTLAPSDWKNPASDGGPCMLVLPSNGGSPQPTMYTLKEPTGTSAQDLIEMELWYKNHDHYVVASEVGKTDAQASGYTKLLSLGYVWPPPGTENATSRYGLPSISKDDTDYIDQNYWHGRTWSPMIQIVYWGLKQYTSEEAVGATAGLVAQSKALLMKEWRGYGGMNSYAGSGRYVYENFGADTGEGYGYSSEAQPMYSWGALAGFIGMQANGFYDPLPEDATVNLD